MRFFIRNFGCRATQADGSELAAELARQGCHATESPAEADLVILNTCTVTGGGGRGRPAGGAARAAREPGGENPGDRLLRAARARGGRVPARGVVGGGESRTRCWIPEIVGSHGAMAHLRGRSSRRPAGSAETARAQPEDPGRVQQPLHVLHHPLGPRAQPQHASGPRGGAGARARRALPRGGAERRESGTVGTRTGDPDAPGGACCDGCWRRRRSSDCGSVRWSRWT